MEENVSGCFFLLNTVQLKIRIVGLDDLQSISQLMQNNPTSQTFTWQMPTDKSKQLQQ